MTYTQQKMLQQRSELVLYSCFGVLYVAVCMHLPVAVYANLLHDDALFIQHGQNIASLNWLGAFNQLTLAKGSFFPIFLALNNWLGIPVTLSIALFYVLATWIFARALIKNGLGRWAALILFVVVLFQPAVFPTRIIRDFVYQSLVLLVLAGILSLRSEGRTTPIFNARLFFFGTAAGAFWLTREEGVWIVPGLALFIASQLFTLRRSPAELRAMIISMLVYATGTLAVAALVSTANWISYGTFSTIDFKGGNFEKALNRLNSVQIENELPYVPVSTKKRALIYKVSPSFRQLEDYFENRGKGWTQPGCAHYPSTCGDYAGGWFMWALRDAVADKGHYLTPRHADRFYASLVEEIDAACRQGDLTCSESVVPFMPQLSQDHFVMLPAALKRALDISFYWAPVPQAGNSWGKGETLQDIQRFLGHPLRSPTLDEDVSIFASWYYTRDGGGWIELVCSKSGRSVSVAIERLESTDIAAHVIDPSAVSQRFSFTVPTAENCVLVDVPGQVHEWPLAEILKAARSSIPLGPSTVFFDLRSSTSVHFESALRLQRVLAQLYQWLGAPLLVVAWIGFLGTLVVSGVRRQSPSTLFWVAGMLWLLYGVRVALVVLIDISSFPAVTYLYLMPALTLLYSAGVMSVVLGLQIAKEWAHTRRDYLVSR
jgi:hypothetical protein